MRNSRICQTRWIIEFRLECNVGICLVRKKERRMRTYCANRRLARHEIDVAFMATRYFLPRVQFAKRVVAYNKKSDTAPYFRSPRTPLISKSSECHVLTV